MLELDPADLNWIGVRFFDPCGRVFRYGSRYYRAVYPRAADSVRSLAELGITESLAERGLMPALKPAPFGVKGYGFVVESETASFEVAPAEWPLKMLIDAAVGYCEINLELVRHQLGLCDGHLGNCVQSGDARPVWVDLGSIVSVTSSDLRGVSEFCECLLHPLLLLQRGVPGRVIRALIRHGGLNAAECAALGVNPPVLQGNRADLFRQLRDLASSLSISHVETLWGQYENTDDFAARLTPEALTGLATPAGQNRIALIFALLGQYQPMRVVDIGANAGFFSLLANKANAAVLAMDNDEIAIEKFYGYLRANPGHGNVQVAVRDVFAKEGMPRADCALALALTHHLSITHKFPFAFIAKTLAGFTSNLLITEFMPDGLGRNEPSPNPLPDGYCLDGFLTALRGRFRFVETIPYPYPADFSKRTLIFCRGSLG